MTKKYSNGVGFYLPLFLGGLGLFTIFTLMGFINFIVKQDQELLKQIIQKLNCMAKSQSEIAQELRDIKAQNEKARAETLAKFTALEQAIINAGNSTPEVDTALAELKASVQTDDDMHEDAPPA